MTDAVVFWSYARRDDEADSGGITHLSKRMQDEYSILTGRELDLFVDTRLEWGELWRERIDSSLASSTFFVPILTPRYFQREECRKELRDFHAQATAYGVQDLVLPILYADIDDFNSDNPDELIALASRRQCADWRQHRVSGAQSAEYRSDLNGLARRLVEVSRKVAERQVSQEAVTPIHDPEQGFYEVLESVKGKWPALIDVIEQDRLNEANSNAQWVAYHDRMNRLRRAGRAGAVPVVIQEMGRAILPLTRQHVALARQYSALALELDPLIRALLREAGKLPGERRLLRDVGVDIEDINDRIQRLRSSTAGEASSEYAKKSQTWRQIEETTKTCMPFVDEGNAILEGWHEEVARTMRTPVEAERREILGGPNAVEP